MISIRSGSSWMVSTLASHARGPGFKPRASQILFLKKTRLCLQILPKLLLKSSADFQILRRRTLEIYIILQIETQVILNSTLKIHASWHVSKWAGKKKSHSFNEPSRGCISTQGAWMSVICSSRVNNKKSRIETCFNFVQTHPLKKKPTSPTLSKSAISWSEQEELFSDRFLNNQPSDDPLQQKLPNVCF